MLGVVKSDLMILVESGEVLFRTLSPTLFQTFAKVILNFQVHIKSILDSYDNN